MIKFPCLCGERFTLTDQMAGEHFQCVKCGRLVSVPTLDDLQHLGTDGTYDVEPTAEAPKRVEHAPVLSADERSAAVARTEDSNPYEFDEPEKTAAPRYDPFTGELVRAHEVIVTEDSPEATRPKVQQPITKMKDRGVVSAPPRFAWIQLFGEMMMGNNVVVLSLMLVIHLFLAAISAFVIGIGFFFAYVIPVIVFSICAGYYSLIVQEMGPGDRDHLPTPLRDFDIRTDVWDPLVYVFVTLGVCLGPGYWVSRHVDMELGGVWISWILLGVGSFFLPVVLLTASVGGIVSNFRPDRMLRVIQIAGFEYFVVVVAWIAGIILLLDGYQGAYLGSYNAFMWKGQEAPIPPHVYGYGLSCILIIAGLYLTYYSMWLLGLAWRKHYLEFPWVGQTHQRKPVALPPPPRQKKKAAPVEEAHFEAEHPELKREPSH